MRFISLFCLSVLLVGCQPELDNRPPGADPTDQPDDSSGEADRSGCLDSCWMEEDPGWLGEQGAIDISAIDMRVNGQVGVAVEDEFVFTNESSEPQPIVSVFFEGPVVCNLTCPAGLLEPGESRTLRYQVVCQEPGEYEESAPLLFNGNDYVLPVHGNCSS